MGGVGRVSRGLAVGRRRELGGKATVFWPQLAGPGSRQAQAAAECKHSGPSRAKGATAATDLRHIVDRDDIPDIPGYWVVEVFCGCVGGARRVCRARKADAGE